jgi:hypothetical protein
MSEDRMARGHPAAIAELALMICGPASPAFAQSFPVKPLRLIVRAPHDTVPP